MPDRPTPEALPHCHAWVVPACCHLTRRQLLRWSAIVSATPLLTALDVDERSYAGTAPSAAVPMNLELVTLTDTSVVLTWFTGDPGRPDSMGRPAPAAADSEVLIGTT